MVRDSDDVVDRAEEVQLLVKIVAERDEADGDRDKVICTGPAMAMVAIVVDGGGCLLERKKTQQRQQQQQ